MARTPTPLKFASFANFPAIGGTGILYIATDTNLIYRWNWSAYILLGSASSGTVTSVATNATLTWWPITTSGTLWLNLANANTWTATQTNSQTTTATPVDGWVLSTSSTATSWNQKASTATSWRGSWWKTDSTASARNVDFRAFVLPEQGSSNPTGLWKLQTQVNNGGWSDVISVDNKIGGVGFKINTTGSNGNPWTTRAITIDNAGTYSWTDYRFSSTLRVATGANSSGGFDVYTSWGNGQAWYWGNSGLTYNSLIAYLYQSGFVHYWFWYFGWNVNAGSAGSTALTLNSTGSFGTSRTFVTSNYTVLSTDSVIYADASSATCAGTPTYACSHWGNQSDCEKWDAHGGCSWYAGSSCSAFDNEYGMSACSWQAWCTVVTASCSWPTDQSTCEAQDDSYGGSCSWNTYNDCSVLDESTCGSTSGCTQNYSDCSSFDDNYSGCTGQSGCTSSSGEDCSAYDGTDQWTCEAVSGCYWNSGDNTCYMTCSGTYYTSCSGNYNTCDGTYNTGSCSGTYGAQCQGTSSCSWIDDSTNCGNETGCTWATSITLNFPSVVTVPNMHVWVYNASSSSADVICQPYSGDTFDQTTSYTLSNYKDAIHAQAFSETTSCGSFNEWACTPSGCTKIYSSCSWDSMSSTCSGDAVCTGISDQMTCEATTYFSYCSGNYYTVKNWYLLSRS